MDVNSCRNAGRPVPVFDNPFDDSLTSLFTGVVAFCSAAVERPRGWLLARLSDASTSGGAPVTVHAETRATHAAVRSPTCLN
jgi:hypothetical protein